MNGQKAKRLRKLVYRGRDYRDRKYSQPTLKAMLDGEEVTFAAGTRKADAVRHWYTQLKGRRSG